MKKSRRNGQVKKNLTSTAPGMLNAWEGWQWIQKVALSKNALCCGRVLGRTSVPSAPRPGVLRRKGISFTGMFPEFLRINLLSYCFYIGVGGEGGIRTRGTAFTVHTLSRRAT